MCKVVQAQLVSLILNAASGDKSEQVTAYHTITGSFKVPCPLNLPNDVLAKVTASRNPSKALYNAYIALPAEERVLEWADWAFSLFYRHNKPFFKVKWGAGNIADNLETSAFIAHRAVLEEYDPTKKCKPSTFLITKLRGVITKERRQQDRANRACSYDDWENPHEVLEDRSHDKDTDLVDLWLSLQIKKKGGVPLDKILRDAKVSECGAIQYALPLDLDN